MNFRHLAHRYSTLLYFHFEWFFFNITECPLSQLMLSGQNSIYRLWLQLPFCLPLPCIICLLFIFNLFNYFALVIYHVSCDIVISHIWSLDMAPGSQFLTFLECPVRNKGGFCYVNEITFGKGLDHRRIGGLVARRNNHVTRELELSVPLLPPGRGEKLEMESTNSSQWFN